MPRPFDEFLDVAANARGSAGLDGWGLAEINALAKWAPFVLALYTFFITLTWRAEDDQMPGGSSGSPSVTLTTVGQSPSPRFGSECGTVSCLMRYLSRPLNNGPREGLLRPLPPGCTPTLTGDTTRVKLGPRST